MKKREKTYLKPDKYRCPMCKQQVPSSDYLFWHRRSASGAWTIVEGCRKCRDSKL